MKYWTTKDGTKIKITEMSDSHLKNTIALLERKGLHKRRTTTLTGLDMVRYFDHGFGDDTMASHMMDQMLDEALYEGEIEIAVPAHPAYKVLKREYKKRQEK